jgi:hypothetical protein
VNRTVFQAKDVAHEMEGPDLTPTVGQQLVTPNGAIHNLIDIVRRLSLSVNLAAPAVCEFAQDDP